MKDFSPERRCVGAWVRRCAGAWVRACVRGCACVRAQYMFGCTHTFSSEEVMGQSEHAEQRAQTATDYGLLWNLLGPTPCR